MQCVAERLRCARLDHIYSTWYFWALNVLLAASLAACSATTQWPQLQVGLNWRFAASTKAIGARHMRHIGRPALQHASRYAMRRAHGGA